MVFVLSLLLGIFGGSIVVLNILKSRIMTIETLVVILFTSLPIVLIWGMGKYQIKKKGKIYGLSKNTWNTITIWLYSAAFLVAAIMMWFK